MNKQNYKDYPSVAYYSGLNGLELKHIEYGIEDYLILQSGSWAGKKQMHRVKIQYAPKMPYVRLYGCRIPLDEFIRIDV